MRAAERFDAEYIIVGSGPGGAVAAFELAQAGRDVLVIEEGTRGSATVGNEFGMSDIVERYRNYGGTVMFGSPKISYVEGRVVGGGSEINSGLYHRVPEETLEQWRKEFAVEGLDPESLRARFLDSERILGIKPLGTDPPGASQRFVSGASALGWNAVEVPRWIEGGGAGSKRNSMSRTYLPRAFQLGARLMAATSVRSFRRDGKRWTLRCVSAGRSLRLCCEHLVLAAGAIQTPALLRRSGIRTHVGNSLQVHPTAKILAEFPEPLVDKGIAVSVHQVRDFAPRISLGCSVSTKPYLGLGLSNAPESYPKKIGQWRNLAVYHVAIQSRTNGTVRNLPFYRDPFVRFQATKADIRALQSGIGKLGDLLFAAGATALYPQAYGAASPVNSIEQLRRTEPTNFQLMTIHLSSTCPMGEDRKRCATDSFGRVFGHKNLYISDASVLCTAPGVNPQGTIMAISSRNVRAWLRK